MKSNPVDEIVELALPLGGQHEAKWIDAIIYTTPAMDETRQKMRQRGY
jgi:hypothetical protein